jgi:hypothetical protein
MSGTSIHAVRDDFLLNPELTARRVNPLTFFARRAVLLAREVANFSQTDRQHGCLSVSRKTSACDPPALPPLQASRSAALKRQRKQSPYLLATNTFPNHSNFEPGIAGSTSECKRREL